MLCPATNHPQFLQISISTIFNSRYILAVILDEILSLLYPTSCIQCTASGPTICPRCESELDSCRELFTVGKVPLYSALYYNEAAAHLILSAKEDNNRAAAKYLAAMITMRFGRLHREHGFERYALIPIPSSRSADYRRGFAHTVVLSRLAAQSITSEYGVRVFVNPILTPTRKVADQSQLGASARAINLEGAFTVKRAGAISSLDAGIIVLDDLVTTGSTISEAIRALRAAELEPISCLSACVAGRFLTNKIGRY
jgi:ComF family protein